MLITLNMNESVVRKLNALITAIVGVTIGLSILQRNYLIPFIAIIAGLALMRFIRDKAREEGVVLADERLELIAKTASDRAFRMMTIALVIFGFVLKISNNALGNALLYIASLMVIVYLIFYRYYASKLGGV